MIKPGSGSEIVVRLNQSAIARHLGVDNSLVSKWRAGTRKPTQEHLKSLAKLLDYSVPAVEELLRVA